MKRVFYGIISLKWCQTSQCCFAWWNLLYYRKGDRDWPLSLCFTQWAVLRYSDICCVLCVPKPRSQKSTRVSICCTEESVWWSIGKSILQHKVCTQYFSCSFVFLSYDWRINENYQSSHRRIFHRLQKHLSSDWSELPNSATSKNFRTINTISAPLWAVRENNREKSQKELHSPSLRRLHSLLSHQGGRANPAKKTDILQDKEKRSCEAAPETKLRAEMKSTDRSINTWFFAAH